MHTKAIAASEKTSFPLHIAITNPRGATCFLEGTPTKDTTRPLDIEYAIMYEDKRCGHLHCRGDAEKLEIPKIFLFDRENPENNISHQGFGKYILHYYAQFARETNRKQMTLQYTESYALMHLAHKYLSAQAKYRVIDALTARPQGSYLFAENHWFDGQEVLVNILGDSTYTGLFTCTGKEQIVAKPHDAHNPLRLHFNGSRPIVTALGQPIPMDRFTCQIAFTKYSCHIDIPVD
jgi:hypothetical protein